jgi:hypothetical protein
VTPSSLDDSVLSRARANGIPLLCYTVNEPLARPKRFSGAA